MKKYTDDVHFNAMMEGLELRELRRRKRIWQNVAFALAFLGFTSLICYFITYPSFIIN